jgi:hypothetical protein
LSIEKLYRLESDLDRHPVAGNNLPDFLLVSYQANLTDDYEFSSEIADYCRILHA